MNTEFGRYGNFGTGDGGTVFKWFLGGFVAFLFLIGVLFLVTPVKAQTNPECTTVEMAIEQLAVNFPKSEPVYVFSEDPSNPVDELDRFKAGISALTGTPVQNMTFDEMWVIDLHDPQAQGAYLVVLFENGCVSAVFLEDANMLEAIIEQFVGQEVSAT